MKKIFTVLFITIGFSVHAQAWAEKYEWPLVAEWQKYNVGNTRPAESTQGSDYWPSTAKLMDPWRASRDGSLTIEDYYLLGRKNDSNR